MTGTQITSLVAFWAFQILWLRVVFLFHLPIHDQPVYFELHQCTYIVLGQYNVCWLFEVTYLPLMSHVNTMSRYKTNVCKHLQMLPVYISECISGLLVSGMNYHTASLVIPVSLQNQLMICHKAALLLPPEENHSVCPGADGARTHYLGYCVVE